MSANSTSEQTIRDALSADLQTLLTGAGNPVQALFGYDISDFQGQSPVVIVKAGAIDRTPRFLGKAQAHVWFFEVVEVWVVVGDKDSPAWTSQLVENTHSLIEKKIDDYCADTPRKIGAWDMLQYSAPASAPAPRVVGGFKYRMRTIPLKARVIGG